MAVDFTAPSFSLGIDLDDDDRRREAAPEAPSFSLGIDDDDDDDISRREQKRREAAPEAPSFSLGIDDDEDDDFLAEVSRHKQAASDKTPDPNPPPPPRFKRLRRGPAPPPPTAVAAASPMVGGKEKEIEEFSEEERPARELPPSIGSCNTSSSSKFSLRNHGILMSQSTCKAKIPKFTPTSNASTAAALEESCMKKLLPKMTISLVRKINLLDSDTDLDENIDKQKVRKPVSPPKNRQKTMHKYTSKQRTLQENRKSQEDTLFQMGEAQMNDSWVEPTLDEFGEGYCRQKEEFSNLCGSKVGQSHKSASNIVENYQCKSTLIRAVQDNDLPDPNPPLMHYFFHSDPLVRELVRERLQHFVPIGAESTQGNEQSTVENPKYTDDDSAGWVTPKRICTPTAVGKRRAQASGSQYGSGHWFTREDGRKVYVSKNGQELTGQIAYRRYRKKLFEVLNWGFFSWGCSSEPGRILLHKDFVDFPFFLAR